METNSEPHETPEYRIFREHYDRLVTTISDPLPLATRLFARSIIDSALLQRVNIPAFTTSQNTNTLLTAVLGRIETDPSTFDVFLSALKEDSSMKLLVESMQRGNSSTTSGAHRRDGSDGGEEQCTHTQEGNTLFLVSHLDKLSVCGETVKLPRHVSCQHHQHHHHPEHPPQHPSQHHIQHQCHHSSCELASKPSNYSLFYPSSYQVCHPPPRHHQPPVQQCMYQLPCYPPFQPPLGQCTYQPTAQPSYYQHPSNQPPLQHSHLPTSETFYQQYHYQTQTVQCPHHPHSHAHCPIHPPLLLPDTPLRKYALFLQACYTEHEFTSTKWPYLDARKYINLAVISNVYTNRKELERFRQQIIHGCIDDILEWKAPIEMKDILKRNYIRKYDFVKDEAEIKEFPVTQLLIEGAPGIGKSTFAWEVCQRWGQHELFNEFSLVVLLKFRDKRVQEAKSISDLFYHPHPKLQSEIVDHIVLSGGHGLLLILERFDEAPASKRTMDSIFIRLFKGQELPKATVILTTRPSASAGLRELCKGKHSRRIEILGFGKKEIDEYIHCVFSDEQSQSDFKEYLSLYPHIHGMMYVPLNSAIVTHVYESCKSSGVVVPKTMTQLYSSLIRTLLLRHLKDKEEYNDTCMNINSFKDLPQPIYDQFCEMCKIAHKGIMCHMPELIFQDLPSDFDPLGLMQTCPELYVDRGASVSYNFFHLTLQEYLAACYISQQSRDKQVAFMREHIESKKLEVVVRFLAGLSELGRELWDVVREFASMAKPSDSLLQGETNFIKLKVLHCLFES